MHKAASYAEAQKWAKRHPNQPVQWDGGEGWTSQCYWSTEHRRFIFSATSEKGGRC